MYVCVCIYEVSINLLKLHCKNSIKVSSTQRSCIVYIIRACVEHNCCPAASATKMWEERRKYCTHAWAAIALYRAMSPTIWVGTKKVVDEDGPAWRVLDDELDQLHRRIGQASGGFHEEDGKVIRVCGEIPEDRPLPSYLVCGPDLLDPGDASSLEDWVAMRIEQRLGGVGRGGGVADGHVDVPTVG